MTRLFKILAACAAAAAGLGLAFVALLALTLSLTSDAAIEAHLGAAAAQDVLSPSSYPMSPFGVATEHQYDMYSDCVAFGVNLSNQDEGLLRRIAASPTAAHEANDVGPCGNLVNAVEAGAVNADLGYLRFWHGYQIYIRPLLSVMSLDAFRRVTAMLLLAVMVLFAWRVERLFGPWAWLLAVAPFYALSDFLTAPFVATQALQLIWAFFSAALVSIVLERAPHARALALPVLVFALGATSNFLNFLINPPLAPALIAFFYIAANIDNDERKTLRTVLYGLGLAALWFAGFFAAWIEKWMFAALVLGPDAVTHELANTVDKYGATRERMGVHFLGASRRNLLQSAPFFLYIVGSIAAACALAAWTARARGAWRSTIVQFVALMTPLAVVVFWVEANSAHSSEHMGFVSRSFVLFSVIPLLAAIKLWRDGPTPQAAVQA
jgi:hypothetical protein